MKQKSNLLLLIAWVLSMSAFGQTKTISVKVNQQSSFPYEIIGESGLVTGNGALNSILASMAVINFYPAYPAAYRLDAPVSCHGLKYYYLIDVPEYNTNTLLSSLQGNQTLGVSEATLTPEVTLAYEPNDYRTLENQDVNCFWYLDLIEIKKAWDVSKGIPDIKIAVIDEGFDLNHPDFAGKVVYSEFPYYPSMEHGNASASLAAGKTDDGVGISSTGFNSSLMFYSYGNYGNTILEAALDGADVINLSFVTSGYDAKIQTAINTASELGVFLVASAGNGLRLDSQGNPVGYDPELLLYPASYDNVFSVTGTHQDDTHRTQSTPITVPQLDVHQHNVKVDLCAPAYHIMHAVLNNGYNFGDGTSFAAPIVAGVVALMKAANPCLSNGAIEQILKETADPIYHIADNNIYTGKLGAGRLNARKALEAARDWGALVVSNSVTVNQSANYKSILIKQGGALTILNTSIGILPGGAITVESGGKLTVLNSVIRSAPTRCINTPYKWNGIMVNGNPKEEQDVLKQGVVQMVNSTIQDAMNAISTVTKDANGDIVWNKTGGGVINAYNSIFRNNGRHLEFLSYHRPLRNGVEPNNQSSFTKCKFFVDDGKILTLGNMVMITLFDVKGVGFSGCTFKNDYNQTTNIRGKGILALDASIIIGKENLINNAGAGSVFENLEIGVDATYSPYSGKLLNLGHSKFIANKFGVSLKEGLSSTIYKNTFDHRNSTFYNYSNKSQVGVQSIYSSGFLITENSFFADLPQYEANSTARNYVGSEIRGSDKYNGTATPHLNGEYLLNGHSNIKYGSKTVEWNALLKVTCNSYSNYYMGMDLETSSGSQENYPNFGNCINDRVDRNNTFERFPKLGPGGGYYALYDMQGSLLPNNGTYSLESYVIDQTKPLRPSQTYVSTSSIIIRDCSSNGPVASAECLSKIKEPGDVDERWDPRDKVNEFVQLKISIPNYPYMDEGNQNLYVRLAELRTDIIYKYNNLLMFDSEEPDRNYLDEYITFLEGDNSLESKKIILATFYSHGLYDRAREYLDLIPNQSTSDANFLAYYTVLIDLKLEDKNVFQMSESQIGIIRGLAGNNDMVSSSAQGILTLVFGDNYERMPDATIIEGDGQYEEGGSTGGDSSNYSLLIYPNPSIQSSNSNFNVDYEIVGPFQTSSIIILNGIGAPVYESSIAYLGSNAVNGSLQISSNTFTPGLFVAQLIVDGVVVSYKLLNLVP